MESRRPRPRSPPGRGGRENKGIRRKGPPAAGGSEEAADGRKPKFVSTDPSYGPARGIGGGLPECAPGSLSEGSRARPPQLASVLLSSEGPAPSCLVCFQVSALYEEVF